MIKYKKIKDNENAIEIDGKVVLPFDKRFKEYLKWRDKNPELEKQGEFFINHKDNDSYRLPKVWPHKLGKLCDIEIKNNSVAGSSNDGIVRRVLDSIPKLLRQYKSEELCVIIGWTSPERKDFFYDDEWRTLYPNEYDELNEKYVTDIKYYLMNISRRNKKELTEFIDKLELQLNV